MAPRTGAGLVVDRNNKFFEEEDVRQWMYLPLKMFTVSTNIRLIGFQLWKKDHGELPSESQLKGRIQRIHQNLHDMKWKIPGFYALQLHQSNDPDRDRKPAIFSLSLRKQKQIHEKATPFQRQFLYLPLMLMKETTNLTEIALNWYCKRHPNHSPESLRNTSAETQLEEKFFNQLHLFVHSDSWDEYLADLNFDSKKIDNLDVNYDVGPAGSSKKRTHQGSKKNAPSGLYANVVDPDTDTDTDTNIDTEFDHEPQSKRNKTATNSRSTPNDGAIPSTSKQRSPVRRHPTSKPTSKPTEKSNSTHSNSDSEDDEPLSTMINETAMGTRKTTNPTEAQPKPKPKPKSKQTTITSAFSANKNKSPENMEPRQTSHSNSMAEPPNNVIDPNNDFEQEDSVDPLLMTMSQGQNQLQMNVTNATDSRPSDDDSFGESSPPRLSTEDDEDGNLSATSTGLFADNILVQTSTVRTITTTTVEQVLHNDSDVVYIEANSSIISLSDGSDDHGDLMDTAVDEASTRNSNNITNKPQSKTNRPKTQRTQKIKNIRKFERTTDD